MKIIFTFFFLFFISCEINVESDIKNIERLLEVKLEKGYQIENKEYDYGIGDTVKSFDIVFDETAFNSFLREVENKFLPVDKDMYEDVKTNIDYYKNYDFDGERIHLSIILSEKRLHYSIVDL